MNPSSEPPPGPGTEPDPLPGPGKDSFRQVYFGQLSEPLVRDHPEPPEAEEDALTQAALGDPEAGAERPREEPTLWRIVLIALVAAVALAIVFGRR